MFCFKFYPEMTTTVVNAQRLLEQYPDIKIGMVFPEQTSLVNFITQEHSIVETISRANTYLWKDNRNLQFLYYKRGGICGARYDVMILVNYYRMMPDVWHSLIIPMYACRSKYDGIVDRIIFTDSNLVNGV